MEIGKQGNMEIWKLGLGKQGNREIWKYENMEIRKQGNR